MNKKIFDIHLLIYMYILVNITSVCALTFIIGIINKELTENIHYAFFVLLILFIPTLFRPVWIEFDKNTLTLHFVFGFFQKINWESIWKVERIFFGERYQVFGDAYGRKSFFTSTKIPCNRKTQRLLREYWNEKFEK